MANPSLASASPLLRAGVSSHRSHHCLQMIATRSSSPPTILGTWPTHAHDHVTAVVCCMLQRLNLNPQSAPPRPLLCPSQVHSLTCGARAHFPFLAGMAGNPHHCCSNDAIGRLHHSPKMYNAPLVSTSPLLSAGVSSHRSHQRLQMIATRSSSPPTILGALSCMWSARSLSLNPRLGGQPT